MIHVRNICAIYIRAVHVALRLFGLLYREYTTPLYITSTTPMIDAARMSLVQAKRVYYINITAAPNP